MLIEDYPINFHQMQLKKIKLTMRTERTSVEFVVFEVFFYLHQLFEIKEMNIASNEKV